MSENAPIGKLPGDKLERLAASKNGHTAKTAPRSSIGSGNTSNIPNPLRTAVLPLWKGSHASPTRGSKLRNVGLEKRGLPRRNAVSVKLVRLASLPDVSAGTVAIS